MANRLTMADIQAILTLHQRGWRNRRIARELNIDRETVAKYLRASACIPKPAKAPPGSAMTGEQATEEPGKPLLAVNSPEGRGIEASPSSILPEAAVGNSKPAKAPIGSAAISATPDAGQVPPDSMAGIETSATAISSEKDCGRSACEPYRQVILEKLEQGLSAQRIYQDLLGDGFDHEYHYVQENGLRGHGFTSLEKENEHLLHWETTLADTRIHGTIRKQVGKLFQEVERRALQPLPVERFPFFHEGKRIVHRDGHVEVAKAYYSAPPEYLGHTLWVRWDLRLVRIFNGRIEQIALHVRKEPGQFSTLPEHIHSQKRSGVERGAVDLLGRARWVGEHTARWAENMLQTRGIEGVRVLQGLLALTKRHGDEAIERACEVAFSHGAWRLRTIRQLLKRDAPEQETFDFLQEHPIIRPLSDYGKLVSTSFEQPRTPASLSVVHCCSSLRKPQETL